MVSIDSREAQGFAAIGKVMTHKSILAHWVKIHSTILLVSGGGRSKVLISLPFH